MSDESYLWGNDLLPLVVEAIGGFDREVSGLVLHFEYGQSATVDIEFASGDRAHRILSVFARATYRYFWARPKDCRPSP